MIPYNIDRDSDTPLYIQIRDAIVGSIESGDILPGDKLPPVTTLSKEIGVTQATVRRALKDLSSAGHTKCHVGRGTFITDPSVPEQQYRPDEGDDLQGHEPAQGGLKNPVEFAARRLRAGVSKALYDIMALTNKPGIIKLTNGVPNPALVEKSFFEEVMHQTLSQEQQAFLLCRSSLGFPELREEVARRFNQQGTFITPDQVLITNGALQALTLIAMESSEVSKGIVCETPCFQGVTDTFTTMGHWVETVQRDEEGPIIEHLDAAYSKQSPGMFYLCPYSHNPSGKDLSEKRYFEIVEWAKKTGCTVIADEIFKDLHYGASAQPSLLNELGTEQTIVVSSLSKTLATGVRIGWIISSRERIQRLTKYKKIMDHSAPPLLQSVALTAFKSGHYDNHVEKMKSLYRERMDTMIHSLETLMPKGVNWSKPDGGFSLILELPKGYSSVALLLSAIEKGVAFVPCPLFDIDQRFVNSLRLSCAWVDKHQIKEGVELLASAIDEYISTPSGDSGLSGLGNFQ